MIVNAADVFYCTGRGTHDPVVPVVTVPPVTTEPGEERTSVPPMFAGSRLCLTRRMEVRCPACPRQRRLGRRLQDLVIEAGAKGLTPLDISLPPFEPA